MPDAPIVDSSTAAAPKDYTFSGSGSLLIKSVRASIDGTGAAGSYVPALQLLAPDGTVMFSAVCETTPAAGVSADVSWFPGGGLGSGATTTNAQWAYASRNAAQTMVAGVPDTIRWTALTSSDSSLFSLGTDNHPNDCIQISRLGVVVVSTYALAGALEPNFVMGINNNLVGFGVLGEASQTPEIQYNTLGLPGPTSVFGPRDISVAVMSTTPQQVAPRYTNFDAVNHDLAAAQLAVLWWPTGVAVT